MASVTEASPSSATELLSVGRRHLAVKDYHAATEALATACELLAKEHGDTGDECAEAYMWYGKALLGLSREESGVLGDGMPGAANADDDEEEDDNDDQENGEDGENGENGEAEKPEDQETETNEAEAADSEMTTVAESSSKKTETTTKEDDPGTSSDVNAEPSTTNGDALDESVVNMESEDDVDNLQLAWEMLELSRSILSRRVSAGAEGARALLAEAHLALGEVALESETYDKAVLDMQKCLEIQKELYVSDDRRIAQTHYQIGLANSLASNFEDAITHFKNAANILETRIKVLEDPAAASNDATVKKYTAADTLYSIEGEIKELKELLPEIQEKIQDMMDYKAETIKRVRETLCPTNGESLQNGAGPSSSSAKPSSSAPAADISHLIKRKRKPSEGDSSASPAKKINT